MMHDTAGLCIQNHYLKRETSKTLGTNFTGCWVQSWGKLPFFGSILHTWFVILGFT